MAGRGWWLGLSAVLWAAGCEDQESRTKATAPEVIKPRAATLAVYEAPGVGLLTPFPSDRYTVADAASPTGRRLHVEAPQDPLFGAFGSFAAPLERADGFSTIGGVAVNFSGDVDAASFGGGVDSFTKADAPLMMIDVDPASPDKGQALPLVVKYYPTRPGDGDRLDFTLIAQPARPLRPRTSYLFVATTRVRDVSGAAIGPTVAMEALRDGREDGGEYGVKLRAALGVLKQSAGVGAEQVALATVFTTASVIDQTFAMAKQRRAAQPPELVGKLEVEEVSAGDGRVRFKGVYTAPEFRKAKPDGRWQIEGGAPVAQSQAKLEFLIAFTDQMKAKPRPVVVYGHGLGGDKSGVWGTAERLAELGVAVIGIDAPEHGSRGEDGPDAQINSIFNFFALDSMTGVFDLERARDNFRQMSSDHLELVRLVQGLGALDVLPVGAPDGVPDLDPSQMLYIGHSFGSVLGSTSLALAPEMKAACLNVGGDGLMTIMRESSTFQILVKGLRPVTLTDGDMARFFAASQTVIDPGDPINYARFVGREAGPDVPGWRPRDVLLQEVFNDKIVPNLSTELLARALGMSHVQPVVKEVGAMPTVAAPMSGSPTLAYFQFDRGDGKVAEHGELIFTQEARTQYVDFFKGALAGGATVINPYK